ncbi:MAG: GNAT family N-acetyltransferase [Deltaproteobacteria bacterium]|nr:GNAT family N-acetyltransferase [Deltaproteobacteria bacterium]
MNIQIRPARPDDAPILAWVMLISGRAHVQRGIWEVILGGTEEECLTFLQQLTISKTPHLFHHSCFLIAEVNGHPVAGLGGYDLKVLGYPALRQAVVEVSQKMGFSGRGEGAMKRSERVLCCIPEEVEGAWIIDSVATVPEFRRKGIVGRLLEEILERGRQHGFRLAQINMYIGNVPARRAYEKHGFKVIDEKRHPYFEAEIGSPGMMRLLRDL